MKWRFGFKRWIVIGLIVLGVVLAYVVGGIFKPVSPAVKLPAEPVWPGVDLLPGVPLTNTLLATFLADLILLAIVFFVVQRFVRSGKTVPQGFYNAFEWVVEFLWNTTEGTAGKKWAGRIFPIMATIFLLVLTANLLKLLPGFESIGRLAQAEGNIKGYAPVQLVGNLYAINGTQVVPVAEGTAPAGEGEHTAALCTACEVVPFLRGASTDLNFTFALAVFVVVTIQVFGFQALRWRYAGKFINVGGMISKPLFGVIDFGVGVLELVSEFSKVLSFGFRLFGNMFAGALLLAILGAMVPFVIPSFLLVLEIFVGVIQAYVFAMLALVFISQATAGHGEH